MVVGAFGNRRTSGTPNVVIAAPPAEVTLSRTPAVPAAKLTAAALDDRIVVAVTVPAPFTAPAGTVTVVALDPDPTETVVGAWAVTGAEAVDGAAVVESGPELGAGVGVRVVVVVVVVVVVGGVGGGVSVASLSVHGWCPLTPSLALK
jgi:hypothetical protein